MTILGVNTETVGQSGLEPKIVYIGTNNTLAEVTTAGFLNGLVAQGINFAESNIALVSTKTTPNATSTQVGFFDVVKSGDNWSLSGSSGQLALGNGLIYVGNPSNVAAAVSMSGDITISNLGLTAISAGVIVNTDISASAAIAYSKLAALPSAQILVGSAGNVATAVAMSGDATIIASGALTIGAGAVTLSKLASGVAPAGVVKYMGQPTTVGGNATEAFSVSGALAASDRAFVQIVDNGTNNVTVLQAVVTNNTLTITFSGDPGNDAVFNYQLLRAAS